MSETPPIAAVEPARTISSRALWNVFSNWGGFALSGVVNFLLAPFVLRHLGNTFYGISVLILSLTGYLGLLDLGVRGAVTRYIARYHALRDHHSSSRFASSALALFAALGGLSILLCLALAVLAPALPVAPEDRAWAQVLLVLLGPNVAAGLISGVFSGILMGLEQFDRVNAVGVIGTVLRALAIVLALSAGGGLITLVWIHLATTLAATAASVWIGFRLYPELHIGVEYLAREHVRLAVSFSAFSFLLVVFDSAILYLNSVLVGVFLSVSLVTFFAIASNLVNYTRAIVSGISKTSTPMASALESRGDERGLQRALLGGASFATVVILPIAITFLIRGSPFIRLWMGPEYAALSGKVLWVLSLGLIFSANNQVALATMLGISQHEPLVPVFLGQALCTFAIGAAVIRPLGIVGIAWAITVPYLVVSLFYWPWYLRSKLRISIRSYVLASWARPLAAVVPFALCTYGVEKLWPATNLVFFFLQTGVILPLALVGSWFVCLTRPERQAVSQAVLQPAFRALRPDRGE